MEELYKKTLRIRIEIIDHENKFKSKVYGQNFHITKEALIEQSDKRYFRQYIIRMFKNLESKVDEFVDLIMED